MRMQDLTKLFVNVIIGKTGKVKSGVVTLDAEDVGALPDSVVVPTKTSDLTNDVPFMSMGLGETVPVNSDLNNYTTPGVYYVPTGGEASQILNTPTTTSGYHLEVKRTTGDQGRIQIAYANFNNTAIYARTLSIPGPVWGSWTKIGQRAVSLNVGSADEGITSFCNAIYDPSNSTVRVYVSARNLSANILTTSVLGVIPAGYRPSSEAQLMGFFAASGGSPHTYVGRVKTDGSICQSLGNTVRQVLLVGEYTI